MSEVDKHANENISRILVGNKKDLEDMRASNAASLDLIEKKSRASDSRSDDADIKYKKLEQDVSEFKKEKDDFAEKSPGPQLSY